MEDTGSSEGGSSSAREAYAPEKDEGIAGAAASAAEEHTPSSYCPVCSERLEARRCKLVCAVCGYYMSCSDYY